MRDFESWQYSNFLTVNTYLCESYPGFEKKNKQKKNIQGGLEHLTAIFEIHFAFHL